MHREVPGITGLPDRFSSLMVEAMRCMQAIPMAKDRVDIVPQSPPFVSLKLTLLLLNDRQWWNILLHHSLNVCVPMLVPSTLINQ
jgi:hypothetical protein